MRLQKLLTLSQMRIYVDSDEETETEVEYSYIYSKYLRIKLVEKLKNLKVELSKLRKNSTQIKSKVKELNKEMKEEKGNVWKEYGMQCTLDTLNGLDNKPTDKDEVMNIIEELIYSHDY